MTDSDIEVISPDGDTILIVGAAKHKFRVSSKRLSEASSVFAALFGPRFREGQHDRSASDPVEIPLPDDGWHSMRRILNMLHRSASTEQGSTWWSGDILDFAISVDKYDLVDALRFGVSAIFSKWFQDRSKCPSIRVLGQVIAAAYLLEDGTAFRQGTKQIIQVSADRMMDLHGEKCSEILPPFVLRELEKYTHFELNADSGTVALEEQRIKSRCEIGHDLCKFAKRLRCGSCPTTYSDDLVAKICQQLGAPCWPPSLDVPLQSIIDNLNQLLPRYHYMGCVRHHNNWVDRHRVAVFLKSIDSSSQGLCLSCVYEEKFDRAASCIIHQGTSLKLIHVLSGSDLALGGIEGREVASSTRLSVEPRCAFLASNSGPPNSCTSWERCENP